jgi:DNA invertase Pin-like site-specific DNA recombinase
MKTMKAALYARVTTHDQQTLPLQQKAMRAYAKRRNWQIASQIKEGGSGAKTRPQREELLKAARRREVDVYGTPQSQALPHFWCNLPDRNRPPAHSLDS